MKFREHRTSEEFHAVFKYDDLEKILVEVMVEHLQELGKLPTEPATFDRNRRHPEVRVASALCEPDGDMGWPGIQITLMTGDTGYYPHTMERYYARKLGQVGTTALSPSLLRTSGNLWKRIKGLFK